MSASSIATHEVFHDCSWDNLLMPSVMVALTQYCRGVGRGGTWGGGGGGGGGLKPLPSQIFSENEINL